MDESPVIEARLCDDDGMVSHERHPKFVGSYIEFMNHLKMSAGSARVYCGAPFECTGFLHTYGWNYRCNSPAHQLNGPHPWTSFS